MVMMVMAVRTVMAMVVIARCEFACAAATALTIEALGTDEMTLWKL